MSTKVLVPSGVLGLGFDSLALENGLSYKPDIICIDGGSTDSGPFYLGSGTSKYARDVYKAEWRELMLARKSINVPLIIGSCGTCGVDCMVDFMYEITAEIALELGQSIRVAQLYCNQSVNYLTQAFEAKKIIPLDPAPDIDQTKISKFSNVVALAGVEQIIEAINTGADIILAGRSTDTASIAALPIMNGENIGGAWHGAKIAECGAFCSTSPTSGVVLVEFDKGGFSVEPMALDARCTPQSVSAHMLYENADPFLLFEPGGYLNVRNAEYEATSERKVRVSGSEWEKSEKYSVKLEGVIPVGYQTVSLVIVRDERYVKNIHRWVSNLEQFIKKKIFDIMKLPSTDYHLDFRLIGLNAVLGGLEKKENIPTEIGVQLVVTANTQTKATELSKLINPFLLHHPLEEYEDYPTFAFPFSPAQIDRGILYEFGINHVMILEDPMDCFKIKVSEMING